MRLRKLRGRGQKGEANFQFRYADAFRQRRADGAGVAPIRRLRPVSGEIVLLRHPAVALPQKADKKRRLTQRTAAFDLFQADLHRAAIFRRLFGDPPTQIDLAEIDPALVTQLADLRKDAGHQIVAFGVHVFERGREKNPDFTLLHDRRLLSVSRR